MVSVQQGRSARGGRWIGCDTGLRFGISRAGRRQKRPCCRRTSHSARSFQPYKRESGRERGGGGNRGQLHEVRERQGCPRMPLEHDMLRLSLACASRWASPCRLQPAGKEKLGGSYRAGTDCLGTNLTISFAKCFGTFKENETSTLQSSCLWDSFVERKIVAVIGVINVIRMIGTVGPMMRYRASAKAGH